MAVLEWDKLGEHFYETGVDKVVLYPQSASTYGKGVAWNGVTSVEESPSGADFSPVYANNIKYLNLQGAEEFSATINAYTYPDEFAECDGSAALADGVYIGQQTRKSFGLCYRSKIGNDTTGVDFGYKIHLVYGANAAPSSKSHSTINENVEPGEMSWSMSTVPVNVGGHKPTATLEIDSTKVKPALLKKLEDVLYGTESEEPRLPLPDEVITMIGE